MASAQSLGSRELAQSEHIPIPNNTKTENRYENPAGIENEAFEVEQVLTSDIDGKLDNE